MWSTGEESGNPFQYSCLENPMNSVKRQQSMGSQRVGHNLATKQQQSEQKTQFLKKYFLLLLQKYNGNIQITGSYCFLNCFIEVLKRNCHMHGCLLQSCPTLCDPMNCSLPGSSVHGILQVRILEWVAISSSKGSSQRRDQTCISCDSCIAGGFFYPLSHQGSPVIGIEAMMFCAVLSCSVTFDSL